MRLTCTLLWDIYTVKTGVTHSCLYIHELISWTVHATTTIWEKCSFEDSQYIIFTVLNISTSTQDMVIEFLIKVVSLWSKHKASFTKEFTIILPLYHFEYEISSIRMEHGNATTWKIGYFHRRVTRPILWQQYWCSRIDGFSPTVQGLNLEHKLEDILDFTPKEENLQNSLETTLKKKFIDLTHL